MSLNISDLIAKKRDGGIHSATEIEMLVGGYTKGKIKDYQIASWLMAVYFRGLTGKETADLTMQMARSGVMLNLDDSDYILDKHSTGGVGDSTTFIVMPLVASNGGKVAKLSGRGLGHTGGTIDKLEAINGFKTDLTAKDIKKQVLDLGMVISGQTDDLVPADKLLYALRDVTATVESIPLIASSIMSKKIAGGAHGIVLDVKVGRGAFMKNLEDARKLASLMVTLGDYVGRDVTVVISDMDVPLSKAQGNTVEVIEAIRVLKEKKDASKRLKELSVTLAQEMLRLTGKGATLDFSKAYSRFKELIKYQGGEYEKLKHKAPFKKEIFAKSSGYFSDADALTIGEIVRDLGAGRRVKEDVIDLDAGLVFNKDLGESIGKGELLATVYAKKMHLVEEAASRLSELLIIGPKPYEKPVVLDIIRGKRGR